jgi:hypothetical protein
MVFSLIAGGLSAIASTVINVASTVSTAIATTCTRMVPVLQKALEIGRGVIDKVFDIAEYVLKELAVVLSSDTFEDMGDRAFQAKEADIVPEKFESYEAYMEAIRNFDLNPEKSKSLSSEEKKIIGLAVGMKAMEEKFSMDDGASIDMIKLIAISPVFFNSERIKHMVETGFSFSSTLSYLNGLMAPSQANGVKDALFQTEKAINPEALRENFIERLHDVADKNPFIEK